MFVRSRLKTVAVFTPPALPGFFAKPTAIPNQTLFCRSPFHGCSPYSVTVQRSPRIVWPPGSLQFMVCCSMLSATPGVVSKYSSLAPLLLLPASSTIALAHPNFEHNGANYQIQRLTLHLAASAQLRVSPATLAAEFPLLTLSIVSRVPSCRLVAVTHFDEHSGWLTTPFPEGIPTPLN
jgi:hypothetical protein